MIIFYQEKYENIEFSLRNLILSHMSLSICTIASPIGDLRAIADEDHLLMLDFIDSGEGESKIGKIKQKYNSILSDQKNPILEKTEKELSEYFSGKRKKFTITYHIDGTEFQKKSWKELENIPYGETRNYQEQATQIGHTKAVRAIGGANHNNPIVIIIPCHRVIGKSGKLVGYGGGNERKKWLLEHEKRNS